MRLDAAMGSHNQLIIDYDDEGRDSLIKAGIFSGIWKAIDEQKIADLEQEVARLKRRNRRLRKKLRELKK